MRSLADIAPRVNHFKLTEGDGHGTIIGFVNLLGERFQVIFTFGEKEGHEHASVTSGKRNHLPSWQQMCALKEIFWEDEEECYQVHPKKSQYVNLIPNCLHIWRDLD